jgi:hypothetical protein
MWCFLCDRPAKWHIPLYLKDKYGVLRASTEESLHVYDDCYPRVQQTENHAERNVRVVPLRSLTWRAQHTRSAAGAVATFMGGVHG